MPEGPEIRRAADRVAQAVVDRALREVTFAFGRRKAWARQWEQLRYCSAGCRKHRPSALDRSLEAAIVELARQRGHGKTLCPSEAARAVRPDDWRSLMERARQAARRLVDAGTIEILQGGRVVDPSTAKGPIRLRLREA